MAQIETNNPRVKKVGKPDMTPLVDLGFLLITFFIYTTTFSKASVMDFATPSDIGKTSPIVDQNTVTIILGENDRIFWHQKPAQEVDKSQLQETDYSPAGVRQIINKAKLTALDQKKFTVIIKPTEQATWGNAVDILDETTITMSPRKAVVELTQAEKKAYMSSIKDEF